MSALVGGCYLEPFLGEDSYENTRNNKALVFVVRVCLFIVNERYIFSGVRRNVDC